MWALMGELGGFGCTCRGQEVEAGSRKEARWGSQQAGNIGAKCSTFPKCPQFASVPAHPRRSSL